MKNLLVLLALVFTFPSQGTTQCFSPVLILESATAIESLLTDCKKSVFVQVLPNEQPAMYQNFRGETLSGYDLADAYALVTFFTNGSRLVMMEVERFEAEKSIERHFFDSGELVLSQIAVAQTSSLGGPQRFELSILLYESGRNLEHRVGVINSQDTMNQLLDGYYQFDLAAPESGFIHRSATDLAAWFSARHLR